jgi:hypothetical protein
VNIINSALRQVSYRRIFKCQGRGFGFGMPDSLTVPFGEKEMVISKFHLFFNLFVQDKSKIEMLLAIAKMNLLHNYAIQFDHSDNIVKWDTSESLFGCTRRAGNRASVNIDYYQNYEETAKRKGRLVITEELDWDSSSRKFGFSYYKGATFLGVSQTLRQSINLEDITDIQWSREEGSNDDGGWTWPGAPEFRDWTFRGTQPTEIAILRYFYSLQHLLSIQK